MCLCVLPYHTHPRAELHVLLTQNDSRQRSLQYSSFLHPLPKAYIVRLNENTHSPDRQVPPLPSPNSTLQVQVRYLWATVTSTSCCDWVYKVSLYSSRDQVWSKYSPGWNAEHEVTHVMTTTWDKLLLGLNVAGVANYFHLPCCKISILPSPRVGKQWPFNILFRLGCALLKTYSYYKISKLKNY